jgi:hypothetical protein
MRGSIAFALLLAFAACTPDIASGSYLCGPEGSCPEGQACNGPDNTCVLASVVQPFSCEADFDFEPDNSATEAHVVPDLGCISAPFTNNNCMTAGDSADWLKFTAPTGCLAVAVEARLAFTIAFEELGLELWDLDTNTKLAGEGMCQQGIEIGLERRCLDFTLTAGVNYGVKVYPTGEGACDGTCNYNRYSVGIQLGTP